MTPLRAALGCRCIVLVLLDEGRGIAAQVLADAVAHCLPPQAQIQELVAVMADGGEPEERFQQGDGVEPHARRHAVDEQAVAVGETNCKVPL